MRERNIGEKAGKIFKSAALLVAIVGLLAGPALAADANYAENGGKWALTQIAWIIVVAGIAGAGGAALKRNFTAAITVVLVAAVIATLCFKPEIVFSIGNVLQGILGL